MELAGDCAVRLHHDVLDAADGARRVPASLTLVVRRFRGPEQPEEIHGPTGESPVYWGWMTLLAAGALLILATLGLRDLKPLIDLATILSFVTAPLLGLLSYRAVISPWVPEQYRPGRKLRFLAQSGIAFLGLFLLFALVNRIHA